jgi:peptidoglycan/xylan/chitin deacetylase (PgdA/CDA1 family)
MEQGAVMFTFDDGRLSTYTEAFPYMQERDIPGTAYVFGERIGWSGHMTGAQLQEMDSAGWSIANHTMSHPDLTELTSTQIEAELADCRDMLHNLGLVRASLHAAYPFGKYDGNVWTAMQHAGMLTGRTIDGGFQAQPPYDWYELSAKMLLTATTLEMAKGYVDEAKAQGAIIIFVLHNLTDTPTLYVDWAPTGFRALVDYVVESGLSTLTINDLYSTESEPQRYCVSIEAEISIQRVTGPWHTRPLPRRQVRDG